MIAGLSGAPLPTDLSLPWREQCQRACDDEPAFSPALAYAIKVNETGAGDDPTIVSGDGGHGGWQLTASYPPDWEDPYANCRYAIDNFLLPAQDYWAEQGATGEALVRCIAAEYNAGRGNAIAGHDEGDVDKYTTNGYAARALSHYQALVAGKSPF